MLIAITISTPAATDLVYCNNCMHECSQIWSKFLVKNGDKILVKTFALQCILFHCKHVWTVVKINVS